MNGGYDLLKGLTTKLDYKQIVLILYILFIHVLQIVLNRVSSHILIEMMMKLSNHIIVIIALLFLVACGEDRTHEYLELTEDNQWIYSKMKENYMWSDSIVRPQAKEFFSNNSAFYKKLLMKYDHTSYFSDSALMTSYGMSFAVMRDPIGIKPSNTYALVLFVEPGSPADDAGIERGMWIDAVNGNSITTSKYSMLERGNASTIYTSRIDIDDEGNYLWQKADSFEIAAARNLESTSLYMDTVYNVQDRNIGYIVCNRFSEGATKEKLADVLSRYSSSSVKDIIIDLRYNSGGSLKEAVECAALFLPSSFAGKVVCNVEKGSGEITSYCFEHEAQKFNAREISIITTSATQGAAEVFAIALQRTLGSSIVNIFGMPTAGANMVTEKFDSPYGFSINPVTAQIYTEENILITSDELLIHNSINELENIHSCRPLGNRQEYILYNTIYYMLNGSLPIPDDENNKESNTIRYIPRDKAYIL